MSIVVVPAVYDDMEALSIIEEDSYSNNGLDGLLFKKVEAGSNGLKARVERNLNEWKTNPTVLYFKAVDTAANNEILGFAMFRLYDKDRVHLIKHLKPSDTAQHFGPAANVEPASEFFGAIWAGRERCVGLRPHLLLQKLSTSPKHQRRGAGSMLVKKGCEMADELGLEAALEASPAGLPLYKKYGYEEQETVVFDPKKYGRDVDLLKTVCMLRMPTAKTTTQ